MPTSKVRKKGPSSQKRRPARRRPEGWHPTTAISDLAPSGLPGILFPADIVGSLAPDFVSFDLDFVVASAQHAELERARLRFERRLRTSAAADFWGTDTSGALAAHVRVQASGSWSLDMQTAADPLSAAQAKLVLRLATSLRPPNSVALVPVGAAPDGYSPLAVAAVSDIPARMAEAINALACLEQHLGTVVALPDEFTTASLDDLLIAAQLIDGRTVQETWDGMQWPMTAAQARELAAGPLKAGAAQLDMTRTWAVDLRDGRRYDLQGVSAHYQSVRVAEWPETNGLEDDAVVKLKLEPADPERLLELRLERRAPEFGLAELRIPDDNPDTIVTPAVFEELLASLDEPAELSPTLVRAAARLRELRA